MSGRLPSGRVTFAFVDVAQSTRTFLAHGDRYVRALAETHRRIAEHATAHDGVVVETEGDGAFLAFPSADAGVAALRALQQRLESDPTSPVELRVRAGAHTGDATPVGAGYVALPVHVAARVTGTAAPGQVIVSDATHAELSSADGDDLGAYSLKDVPGPTRLWRMHGDDTPPRATPARRTNVPEPTTPFLGRNEEIQQLTQAVSATRLVTVVGPGGVGKTRLVTEWALARAQENATAVWVAELASATSSHHLLPAVAAACGVVARTEEELADAVSARGRAVIVLDNCEHLLDEVAALAGTLLRLPGDRRLLCTSREPLAMPGEVVHHLSALDPTAASSLFRHHAASAGADELPGSVVQAMCDELDALPLAIELVALHADSVPDISLLETVRHELLTLGRRGGDERQRSLDAALDWSVRDLPDTERRSLLALSVWPGRFDQSMADALLTGIPSTGPRALRPLVRKNLVARDGEQFRLLFPVRASAWGRLQADPELDRNTRAAIVGWAVDHARRTYGGDGNYDDEPLDRVLALERALAFDRDVRADDIAWVWELLRVIAHHGETGDALREEAEHILLAGPPATTRDALVHAAALRVLTFHGDPHPLPPEHSAAIVRLVRETACPAALSFSALSAVAWQWDLDGHPEDALGLWEEARALVESAPELTWAGPGAVGALATNRYLLGDVEGALTLGRQSVEIAHQLGVARDLNILEGNLAEMLNDAGRHEEAIGHARAAVQLTPGQGASRVFFLRLLATAYAGTGDRESAAAAGRELFQSAGERSAAVPFYATQVELLLRDVPELRDAAS